MNIVMEQKYFDCTYRFDSKYYHNGVHLFNSRYKEMLDGVFIDGKFYSPEDEIRPSEGEHSVRLVFKKGVEPERLSNFFYQTDIMSINDTNIDSSKIKHMLAFSSYKSLPNLDVFKDLDVPRVKDVADMFRACKSHENHDALQEAEKQVKGKGLKR